MALGNGFKLSILGIKIKIIFSYRGFLINVLFLLFEGYSTKNLLTILLNAFEFITFCNQVVLIRN